jgi:hypothetical protein
MTNAILAATRRARVFERTERLDPFSAPIAQRSALHEYCQRQPRPPPGKVIAVHPSTDASAVLRRVLGEDDHRRLVERERKRKWRARRSPDQVAGYRARDREAARRRRSPPSAG